MLTCYDIGSKCDVVENEAYNFRLKSQLSFQPIVLLP
jgi:hypothetical protein